MGRNPDWSQTAAQAAKGGPGQAAGMAAPAAPMRSLPPHTQKKTGGVRCWGMSFWPVNLSEAQIRSDPDGAPRFFCATASQSQKQGGSMGLSGKSWREIQNSLSGWLSKNPFQGDGAVAFVLPAKVAVCRLNEDFLSLPI